jgi:hypothetical protein
VAEGGGDDDLGHAVHLGAEVTGCLLHGRPVGGEIFVGDPAQQLDVAGHQLAELELLTVFGGEPERPAAEVGALGAARILDDAVE